MDRRRFLAHNLVGATGWAVLTFVGGYWLGAIPLVSSNLGLILLSTVAISALPGLTTPLRARMARPRPARGTS